ncbi:PRC-barrel domain-containing protein [Halobaculum sp. CBA1158]|uniref:PRC-barrel domain-containing protein n=1 Tax=Halobaculum sp. CBA1158 TaxID=2904243 RepID=UPI001F1959E8|nr:PRC-barrel domain-containing protein [Halobaculum sp. CBA1158]UIO99238.1 PRC-barrel domain-containing protein [Halobaculum sp. CBA1158]
MASDSTPVTALADKQVYTADGERVGRVVDVVVDLMDAGEVSLALADVERRTLGTLPSESAGLTIPFRYVRGVNDAVVLRISAREAAFPLPGSRDRGGDAGPDVDGDAGLGAEAPDGDAREGSAGGRTDSPRDDDAADDDPIV